MQGRRYHGLPYNIHGQDLEIGHHCLQAGLTPDDPDLGRRAAVVEYTADRLVMNISHRLIIGEMDHVNIRHVVVAGAEWEIVMEDFLGIDLGQESMIEIRCSLVVVEDISHQGIVNVCCCQLLR